MSTTNHGHLREGGAVLEEKYVSFIQQLKALLLRNVLIKRRQGSVFFFQIFLPILFILFQLTSPAMQVFQAKNETSVEGTLYLENGNSSSSYLKPNWYIVSNDVFDETQMRQFVGFVQTSAKVICGSRVCRKQNIIYNTTFKYEQDFDKFYSLQSEKDSTNCLAIILNSYNESFSRYTIRYPASDVLPTNQLLTVCFEENATNCSSYLYLKNHFSLVQAAVDSAILSLRYSQLNEGSSSDKLIPNFEISVFPRAEEVNDYSLPSYVAFSFIITFAFISKDLVSEKENRIKDALLMMGLNNIAYTLSWALVECGFTFPGAIAWTFYLLFSVKVPVNALLLYIFIQIAAFSLILLAFLSSFFFSQIKPAQIVITISSFLLYGALYYVCDITPISESFIFKILFFLSPFPFTGTLREIIHTNENITFMNMFSTLHFPFGFSLLALAFDCVFYFGSALFIDYLLYNSAVVNFFETLFNKKESPSDKYDLNENQLSNANIEPITEDFQEKRAIDIEKIVKKFNTVEAIKNITLQLYESQITAFLGPNSAGKTTLLRMLTGELRPTSGEIYIYGHHIQNSNDLWKIRTHFGVCLQEDIIMEGLTPPEHLSFIAKMKGLSDSEVEFEVDHILEILELTEEKDTRSENLSGGQKRKLCIAMAVIAQSKVIFLDEPTSGVDPHSRRKIWTALQSLKKGRVIILTTHFMDEADILSDRKAFIINGKLHCVGSSLFLKSKFGVGYHLRIETAPEANKNAISDIIRDKVPSARLDRTTNSEMIFTLPKEKTSQFPALFQSLDQSLERADFGLKDYGLITMTLEDVFLQICHNDDVVPVGHSLTTTASAESGITASKDLLKQTKYKVDPLIALFYLARIRCKVLLRDYSFIIVFIFYGILTFVVAKFVKQQIFSQTRSLVLSTELYDQKTLLYRAKTDAFNEAIDSLSKYCSPKAVNNFTIDKMKNAIYAIDIAENDTISAVYYDVNHLHSLPILQNLVSNVYASRWLSQPFRIEAASRPFTGKSITSSESFMYILFFLYILASFFTSVPATLAVQAVKERDSKVKNHLKASGISSFQYWASFLVIHSIFFGVANVFASGLALWTLALGPLFGDWQFWLFLITMNVLVTSNSLLSSYVLSFIFEKAEMAESYLGMIIYLLIAVAIMFWILTKTFFETILSFVSFILLLICPFASPLIGYYELYSFAFMKQVQESSNVSLTKTAYFDWDKPFLPNILALVAGLNFYLLLLYLTDRADSILFCKALCCKRNQIACRIKLKNDDPDVLQERKRVQQLFNDIQSDSSQAPLLLLKDLTKAYDDKVAVNSLSLAVESGQIFGLLGSNGAGKSTTMRIICNDEVATSGHVFINGKLMTETTSRTELLSYCPQNNPLWEEITLSEHLSLFSAIRGVPKGEIENFTKSLIEILAIEEHASKRSNYLSGGTKRKLCLLVSIIGDVNLTLLDECSTGMDPKSKRLVWDLLTSHFEPSGAKSAILTTHSMEEVDALCTRMAIMRKGVVQCIGTIQHLKNKFGSGYILEVSFKPTFGGDRIYALAKEQLFPNAKVLEKLNNNIKLEVPQSDIRSMALVFETLQQWLLLYKNDIEEYSFCQSSIELVFIRFAEQDD